MWAGVARGLTFSRLAAVITRALIGQKLYPQTAAELAAAVTPTDYAYPPGDVRRYGAVLDGVTNDTAALAAAVSIGAGVLIPSGTLLTDRVTVAASQCIRCEDSTVKARSEAGILTGNALFDVTASDCDLSLVIDFAGFGIAGVKLTGSRNRVRIVGQNLTGSASSQGSESLVVDEADDNEIDATAHTFAQGAAPNGSVPRIVTCQTASNRARLRVKGYNVQCGVTLGACADAVIESIALDTVADNGVYALAGSARVKLLSGRIRGGDEPIVDLGTDNEWSNCAAIDCSNLFGVESATRSRWKQCTVVHTSASTEGGFLRTRAGNGTTNGLYLENCSARINIESGLIVLGSGTVNDLQVTGGQYVATYHDGTTLASTKLVAHAAGDRVLWRGVALRIKDARTVPLVSGDLLLFELPALSAPSWFDVDIVNESAGSVRVTGLPQANCVVRWSGWSRVDVGPYLQTQEDGGPPFVGFASAAPTVGTWAANSILYNVAAVAGEPQGWYCETGGTPGTWREFGQVGYRSGVVSPVGAVVPKMVGEKWLDTAAPRWYLSTGPTNADWVALN